MSPSRTSSVASGRASTSPSTASARRERPLAFREYERGVSKPEPFAASGSSPGPLSDAARRLRRPPGRKPTPRAGSATASAHSSRTEITEVRRKSEVGANSAQAPIASGLPGRASAPLNLLTIKETAAYLRCSSWFVRQLLQGGYLTSIRLPAPVTAQRRSGALRRVLIDRQDVDALIARGRAA
jgi:hypothetical protein